MPSEARFLWSWVGASVVGELVGMAVAALASWALLAALGAPDEPHVFLIFLAGLLAAGAVEGASLGAAEWVVLRQQFPRLRARRWIGATAGGAVVAGFLGVVMSGLAPLTKPVGALLVLVTLLPGAVLGAVLGGAQWLVLRRHARGAARWVAANAVAWGGGMLIAMEGASLVEPHDGPAAMALIGAITGALAGLFIGGITGGTLLHVVSNAAKVLRVETYEAQAVRNHMSRR